LQCQCGREIPREFAGIHPRAVYDLTSVTSLMHPLAAVPRVSSAKNTTSQGNISDLTSATVAISLDVISRIPCDFNSVINT
jgi:16S rRNA G527 N7-methylase RsmG